MRIVKLGLAYFALVFAIGFILGTLRVLWLVPALGERQAELLEIPVMIAASFLVARFLVTRERPPLSHMNALWAGVIALFLLLGAEFTIVLELRGFSLSEYFATRDPISATAYYASLLVFMLLPWLIAAREHKGKAAQH